MTTATNRVVRWAGARRLTVEDAPFPDARPDQVVVQVHGVGICGTDLSVWRGQVGRARPGVVLGHEFGGTVAGVGSEVAEWREGQAVAIDPNDGCGDCSHCREGSLGACARRKLLGVDLDGGLCRYLALDPAQLVAADPCTEPHRLALAEPLAVAVRACERARIAAGSRVGVIGAGSIGTACVVRARDLGAASVTVVEAAPDRRADAARRGIDAMAPDELRPDRWDAVVDTVGIGATAASAAEATQPGGTVCVVGLAPELTPPLGQRLVREEITLTGSFCYSRAQLHEATRLLARIDPADLPVRVLDSLDHAPEAFLALADGALGPYKTVFRPEGAQR
ncbi:zinc-dependent alcohol dehydrogenase [Pseudonocardia acaciae]|uniref:zinc-dependent alcohol dehydrogenase n=1 Tax=Pseudonocardia acaciae TaxID=551276 RepID=UPI0012EE48B5|nr:alcohol dehydrogenase catalytic domain-containing protein [Pseudonocardia acaciae]